MLSKIFAVVSWPTTEKTSSGISEELISSTRIMADVIFDTIDKEKALAR
jgi:hypothetical protein